MLCPFCGSELEKGSLVTGKGHGLLWLPEENLPQGFGDFLSYLTNTLGADTQPGSARIREKYGAFRLREDPEPDLYVAHYGLSICRHCGKGILNVVDADAPPPAQPEQDR